MATLGAYEKRHRVTVVGSGNWGSAIAKIVAENTKAHPDLFEPEVRMVRRFRLNGSHRLNWWFLVGI